MPRGDSERRRKFKLNEHNKFEFEVSIYNVALCGGVNDFIIAMRFNASLGGLCGCTLF